MRMLKKGWTIFLALVMCITTILPVNAANSVTQDGVIMTVTAEKDTYTEDEVIAATIKVENTSNYAMTDVSLEGIVPEGYGLQFEEGESSFVGNLAAGETKEISAKFCPITVLYEEDFEYDGTEPDYLVDYSKAAGVYVYSGSANAAEESDANKVLAVSAENEEFQVNVRWSDAANYSDKGTTRDVSSKTVVYEFDIKPNTTINKLKVNLRSENGGTKYSRICEVVDNQLSFIGVTGTITLTAEQWYRISVANDYITGTQNIYVNGELIAAGNPIHNFSKINTVTMNDFLRFHYEGEIVTNVDFMIDNVKVYAFGEKSEEEEIVITIDPNKSIFNEEVYSTAGFEESLKGYVSLHTRSGVVYVGDTKIKTKLETLPVETENGYLVVLDEICQALGLTYEITGNTATVKEKTVTVSQTDGKTWVNAKEFLGIYGIVSVDENEIVKSSGMMIAGAAAYEWPSTELDGTSVYRASTPLQKLNNYLFFEEPSADKILELYTNESSLAGKHPRILATVDDFERIKKEVETNAIKNDWYQQLIGIADYLVEVSTEPVKYEFSDGIRLLAVSREVARNMYVLGMAYQLTGETKYVDRAWVDLEAASNFKDWHPEHDIDCSEMATGVAIGYDWMYDAFTEEQRKTIEYGMYKNCFAVVCESYQSSSGVLGHNPLTLINHNIVLNGGFAIGALALMDVYPEVAAHITSMTIKAGGRMIVEYGPDGAWKEGPGYWEYATQFTSKMLCTLDTIFGTCFSLDKCEGLDSAAEFMINLQSDQGIFNYGDGTASQLYVPEMFYLSNKYGNESITAITLEMRQGKMTNKEDIALALLWYNTNIEAESADMDLGAAYWTEGVATFRDKWTSGATAFVGVHGGATRVCHQQVDGGTFVYDYAGIRWAKDLGGTPYDTAVSGQYGVDGGRWLLYRSRAESHNTIVINPDNSAGQKIDSVASLVRFENKTKGGIAVLDMSDNYSEHAESAIRGLFFTDDRTSLVVRDEINLKQDDSTVYWFMQTDAAVEIDGNGQSATLTQAGKQIKLEFVTNGNGTATLSVGPSTRELLGSTSPVAGTSEISEDTEDSNVNRIAIKVSGASGHVAITTKLTPIGVGATSIDDYNKSISEWTIPDGEIAAKPELKSVMIDGREVRFDSANQATFLCVEGKYDGVPTATVTVEETKYTYDVTNATTTDGGITTIAVRDKVNSNVYTLYTIVFAEIPEAVVPEGFDNMTALQVVAAEASDEPEANIGYVAWKTLDQDKKSRWTSQGAGQWILFELEEEATVDNLLILFKNGHVRSTYFDITVSTDGENYETIWTGLSGGTAIGNAEAYEQFPLGGVRAKYIKLNCSGNTAQGYATGWNNIGEVVFTGTVLEPTPTPEPSEEPTPTPGTEPTPIPGPSTEPTPTPGLVIIANSTDMDYYKGNNETVIVYCSGEYSEFVGVDMDGKEVDVSNYTVKEGSTVVEFKTTYLETLSDGDHTVTLRYTKGRSVESVLRISAKANSDTDDNGATPEENVQNGNDISDNVKDATIAAETNEQVPTGDDSRPLLWSMLFVVALCLVLTLGVLYRRKSKGLLSLLFACILMAGMSTSLMHVQAEETPVGDAKSIEATEIVKVGEENVTLGFKLTYTLSEEDVVAGKVYYTEDFEYEGDVPDYITTNAQSAGVFVNGGSVSPVKEDENTALKVTANNETYEVNTKWSGSTSNLSGKSVVYEFDLIPNGTGNLWVNLTSNNGGTKTSRLCEISSTKMSFKNANTVVDLTASNIYHIAVVNNYVTGTYDAYVNGTSVVTGGAIHNNDKISAAAMYDLIRFQYSSKTTTEFTIDNVKVYEAKIPCEFK